MISTYVENAVAAQKIEIRLVIHVEEIRALGTRIDFVETNYALRCHERAVYVPVVQLVVFAKTRGDNLFQIESHEEQKLSDSRSKRKSVAASLREALVARRAMIKKKLQDSQRILQLTIANTFA
jgi:hypothetical protein